MTTFSFSDESIITLLLLFWLETDVLPGTFLFFDEIADEFTEVKGDERESFGRDTMNLSIFEV